MKKMTIIWTITLLVVVGGLTAFGFRFKKDNAGTIAEEALVDEAKRYLGMYQANFPLKGEKKKFTAEYLKSEGFEVELGECDGYVIVKNGDMGYTYDAYVKCPDYITKDYSNE